MRRQCACVGLHGRGDVRAACKKTTQIQHLDWIDLRRILIRRRVFGIDRDNRKRGWEQEFRSEFVAAPRRELDGFVMQEMHFDLPSVLLDTGDVARRVTVRRGLSGDLIRGLANAGDGLRETTERLSIDHAAAQEPVRFVETTTSARLDYGNLFFSEIEFD